MYEIYLFKYLDVFCCYFQLYISENFEIFDYCCIYVLLLEDIVYLKVCDYLYQKVCDECNGIISFLDELQEVISCYEVNFIDCDQKDDI